MADSEKQREGSAETATETTGGKPKRATDSLQEILDANEGDLRLGDFVEQLGARAFGITLLFLSLATVLVGGAPGFSTVLGLPIVLLSLQIVCGRSEFWLPGWLARVKISHDGLEGIVTKAQALLKRIERFVRPRLQRFVGADNDGDSMTRRLLGAYIALLGIVLALPVLFGNFLPAMAIAIIAVGLIEKDGCAVIVGGILGLLSIAYAVAFFTLGAAAIERMLGV